MNNAQKILSDLIAIKTDDKTLSNKLFVDYVCDILSQNEVLFETIPNFSKAQESIIAGINVPRLENIQTGLVLSGHMDTVAVNPKDWQCDPFQGCIINGEMYGRGAVDMKYFLAVVLSILPELKALKMPVFLLFSCDEETDVTGIQTLVDFLKERNIHPRYALIGEPSHFDLCTSNRGYAGYTTIVKGVSAHSSCPALGVNAAYIAARIVSYIEKLSKEYATKQTTMNVGVLSGGQGRNLIPSEIAIDWEIRYDKAAVKDEILNAVKQFNVQLENEYKNSQILLKTQEVLPPFEKKENSSIVNIAKDILNTNEFAMPFATEAGFLQSYGIETLICGAGNENLAHCANEKISIDDLQKYSAFLIEFATRIQHA